MPRGDVAGKGKPKKTPRLGCNAGVKLLVANEEGRQLGMVHWCGPEDPGGRWAAGGRLVPRREGAGRGKPKKTPRLGCKAGGKLPVANEGGRLSGVDGGGDEAFGKMVTGRWG